MGNEKQACSLMEPISFSATDTRRQGGRLMLLFLVQRISHAQFIKSGAMDSPDSYYHGKIDSRGQTRYWSNVIRLDKGLCPISREG
ncbi:hypothetical protein BaRGS_00017544 [Batillaria attramentaria]|uniref:Uncharacterized protein n=1 Tax=Batillaria attramentaria TaxID=370345 RepID=A0ABD0KVH2_9CAEN